MPRAKRPLEEVDPNASTRLSNRKTTKTEATATPSEKELKDNWEPSIPPGRIWRTPSERYPAAKKGLETGNKPRPLQGEQFDYRTKDNSKLRSFLLDRGLPTYGTREELIARLENSSIDYNTLSSAELTEILKRREVKMAASFSKEVKIQRLRINDKIDRDTGNHEEAELYVKASLVDTVYGWIMEKKAEEKDYASMNPKKLRALLEKNNLPLSGSKTSWAKRLETKDRKDHEKSLKNFHTNFTPAVEKLARLTGRPVNAEETLQRQRELEREDAEIQMNAAPTRPPAKICSYDGSNSHWASRTERELSEICARRGMPGRGPKAAMLKWLDTGSIDYEDLYACSLEMMCYERNITHKSGATKVELIKLLREADESES